VGHASARPISIGWDVRGWRSRSQSVAVAEVLDGQITWLGLAPAFAFETATPVDLDALVRHAVDRERRRVIQTSARVVVAIDSPLAFPKALRRLIDGDADFVPTATEIDNPLAYRDCDRRVAAAYGMKPLSAAFDRLGNTASLAMTLCGSLREQGFSVIPQDADRAEKAAIEVYPGIHKRGLRREDDAIEPVSRWIPAAVAPGSDLYDACICAILGLVFAGAGEVLGLPTLTTPDSTLEREEGWIFGLPPDFVRD